jgi:hypothetical protein
MTPLGIKPATFRLVAQCLSQLHRQQRAPFLFICALEYAISRVQVNLVGFELNGTLQLLVYGDDVYILGGSVHTVKKSETLVVARKDFGVELNADKTKYMVMSVDQNVGQSSVKEIDNSSLARVEEFKYLGTTLANRNSIQEEIKCLLSSGNACYHSVQNFLSTVSYQEIERLRHTFCLLFCMGVKLGRSH